MWHRTTAGCEPMRAVLASLLSVALASAPVAAAEPETAATGPATDPSAEPAAEPTTPPPAPDADPRAEAAAAFLEGSKYYELGQFSRAVERFEHAWELSREPLLLFNLGRTHYEWFKVDGDADHLRRAKMFYQNYAKRMRGSEGYNDDEVAAILRTLDLELEKASESQEGKVDRELRAREESERRRALVEREKRIVKGFNASGNALIVTGSVMVVMGIAGILVRTANKIVLDNSSAGDRSPNLSSAEEDARRRRNYLVGGQLAFSGFIIGSILLPVGIALRVVGEVRERRALGASAKSGTRARLDVDAAGLTVRF